MDMCCLPSNYALRLSGTLPPALGELRHHLFVQPHVHFRRAVERASIAEFLRQLLAGAKSAVQFQ